MYKRQEYERILHYLRQATEGWQTRAHTCSSLTGEGIDDLWHVIDKFKETVTTSGIFTSRRKEQTLAWVYSMVEENLHNRFYQNERVRECRSHIDKQVAEGKISATMAMQRLLAAYEE